MGGRKDAAQVARGPLVRVEGRQLEWRDLALAVERVGLEKAADDDVRMRIVAVDGDEGGDAPLFHPVAEQVRDQVEDLLLLEDVDHSRRHARHVQALPAAYPLLL